MSSTCEKRSGHGQARALQQSWRTNRRGGRAEGDDGRSKLQGAPERRQSLTRAKRDHWTSVQVRLRSLVRVVVVVAAVVVVNGGGRGGGW